MDNKQLKQDMTELEDIFALSQNHVDGMLEAYEKDTNSKLGLIHTQILDLEDKCKKLEELLTGMLSIKREATESLVFIKKVLKSIESAKDKIANDKSDFKKELLGDYRGRQNTEVIK